MSIRAVITVGLLAIAGDAVAQAPQEIRLWPGKAPGSENWTIPEVTTTSPMGDRTITNVSDPTVTVFLSAGHRHRGGRRLRPLLGEWARSVDADAKALNDLLGIREARRPGARRRRCRSPTAR